MTTKHTPGPWAVCKRGEDGWEVFSPDLYRSICPEVHAVEGNEGEAEANASLISAGPDMLAALELAEKELRLTNLAQDGTQRSNTPQSRALVSIRAAIAKALGEEPPR